MKDIFASNANNASHFPLQLCAGKKERHPKMVQFVKHSNGKYVRGPPKEEEEEDEDFFLGQSVHALLYERPA